MFHKPIVVQAGAGRVVDLPDNRITLKAVTNETEGQLTVLEVEAAPGSVGPPLHYHHHSETFYVLSGSPVFKVGDEMLTGGPGLMVVIPGEVIHGFANPGDEAVRLLMVCVPGRFETYYEDLAAYLGALSGPADPEMMADIARRYGQINVGPPLGAAGEATPTSAHPS
jgi:mannose-6-phosphate isomerase-like protein (cupin superfamily)